MTDVVRQAVQPADELAAALTAEARRAPGRSGRRAGRGVSPVTPPTASRCTRSTSPPIASPRTSRTPGDRQPSRWSTSTRDLFADLASGAEPVALVRAKLASEPIEDLRIDFEDGYGDRGDEVEDADTLSAAAALARASLAGTAPPYHGIRFKSLEAPTRRRGIRTLTMFLSTLLEEGGTLDGFVVTLPKITSVEQVEAMVRADRSARGLPGTRSSQPALRAADRDTAVDPRPGRHRPGRPDDPRRRPPRHRAALRHLRLLGLLRDPRRLPEHGAPGCRPRQAGDAGSGSRHRRSPVRRVDQRAAGRRRDGRTPRLGAAREVGTPLARARVTTRDGTCIPPSCRPASPRRTPSSARASPRRPSACATTWSRPGRASWTSPPPPGRCPTSSRAASTAAPSRPRRSSPAPGWTWPRSPGWPGPDVA